MEGVYQIHTGHSREKLRQDMERDMFMSPEQAMGYGLIDKVISPREVARFQAAPEAVGSKED